jgi:hypothetical protein
MDSTLDREQRQVAWTQAARDADVAERDAAHDAMRRPTLDDAERQGRDRRDAARAASDTRRLALRDSREGHRRACFSAYGPGGRHLITFAPGDSTLEDILAALVGRLPGTKCDGFGPEDLAVWHGDRLVATVRRGIDGRQIATICADA